MSMLDKTTGLAFVFVGDFLRSSMANQHKTTIWEDMWLLFPSILISKSRYILDYIEP